jgi:glutaredoxin-related protein
MVVKIYISGMSGNKEVKKRQQRVTMILESKTIKYEIIDITEPGAEAEKEFMQTKSTNKGATIGDPDPRTPLPPQLFNDEEYCGDYDGFDLANECDILEQFLKLAPSEIPEPVVAPDTTNEVDENKENVDDENKEV